MKYVVQAYGRATSLDDSCWYSWAQAGSIELCLGASPVALLNFKTALKHQPDSLAALLGCGQACLHAARQRIHDGALGEPD